MLDTQTYNVHQLYLNKPTPHTKYIYKFLTWKARINMFILWLKMKLEHFSE